MTILSWDAAADAAAQDIYARLIDSSASPAPTTESIRLLFDAFDNDLVGELRPEQKEIFHFEYDQVGFWKELGAIAIRWGKENGYEISREELHTTLVRKQRDYGHHNIARYGTTGLVIRVHDKIARLENLTKNKLSPNNESIADTVMDIAGYSAIGMMWNREQFMLPLEPAGL
ncbi:MAG: DUF1599 domain-containing protein [Chitinophagales bacterium]|nr:DUF1599 domain-containing protein [Chitinophagales bacterium]